MLGFRSAAAAVAIVGGLVAFAVPAAVADPMGHGLYTEHHSTCTYPDGSTWSGNVTLLPDPSQGISFWANGTHLVIQNGFVAGSDEATEGDPFVVGKGQKTGLASRAMIKCHGYFPEYGIWVTSFSIPRP